MTLLILFIYFVALLLISIVVGSDSNDAFFRGNRKSPWPLVAFGMVGASISGLTFIGVPGWVMGIDMTYMQMCFGFIVGYLLVAFVLLPIYYKYSLVSIYTYLQRRFGETSYRTGASFFILSKMLGAAAKFYVVVSILQGILWNDFGSGFNLSVENSEVVSLAEYTLTAVFTLAFIWLYTRRAGIRSLVWTDVFQTFCMIAAMVLILMKVCGLLDLSFMEAMSAVWHDSHSRMFEFQDVASKQYFWKQFLSGIFIVVVMTGLDQDMMQKNLTCKNLHAAQKDMCFYGLLFAPVNFLFLAMGVLLLFLYSKIGMPLPLKGDDLLSGVIFSGVLGQWALVLFTIGVVASAFSSADSSLTALTTSCCVDVARRVDDVNFRKKTHLVMMVIFLLCTMLFHFLGSGSIMDLIYTLVSYTYGPLLGLFAFGIFTKRNPSERFVPWIAISAPIICYAVSVFCQTVYGYKFGYEMLMFNGLLVFLLLLATSLFPKGCKCGSAQQTGHVA